MENAHEPRSTNPEKVRNAKSPTQVDLSQGPSALDAIKVKQRTAWSSGDYSRIGVTLQIVGETLSEAVDLHAGEHVLDVASGNGNAALAAARRGATVLATDYVPSLLTNAQARAAAERLDIEFSEGDAEALPFVDADFDVVLSTFGVMFTANQERAAAELLRVCRPGGRIGLANWTPEGFVGQLFKAVAAQVPPPPIPSPLRWGTESGLYELLGDRASSVSIERRQFTFRYISPKHWLHVFREFYGPVNKAFGALDARGQEHLSQSLLVLARQFNRATDGTLVVPSDYLEVVVHRK